MLVEGKIFIGQPLDKVSKLERKNLKSSQAMNRMNIYLFIYIYMYKAFLLYY